MLFLFLCFRVSAVEQIAEESAQFYVSPDAQVVGQENVHVQKSSNVEQIRFSGKVLIIEASAVTSKSLEKQELAISKPNPEKNYREVAKKIKASAQKTSYTNPINDSSFTQADAKTTSAVLNTFVQVQAIVAGSSPTISTPYFYKCQFFGYGNSQEFPHLLHAFSVRPPPFFG